MKKNKTQKGITLIALIITIVVLLILAIVTIGSVKDSGIIGHAQNAANDYTLAKEKEQIGLALSEWQIQKNIGGNTKTFKDVVEAALEGNATVSGDDNGPLTITMNKTGNQYIVTDTGEILPPTKGISISPTELSIAENETGKITTTLLGGLQGDITYSSSDESVATVSSNGEVTGISIGSAAITVTCGEYSATCKVGVSNIKEYLFGTSLSGRLITDILDINNGQFLNEKAPLLLGDETITPRGLTQIGEWGIAYFEYQGIYYKIRANLTSSEVDGVPAYYTDANYGLVTIANTETRIGKTVKYDNKLWTIIYDDNTNGLQMISNDTLYFNESGLYGFELGWNDSLIKKDWSSAEDLNNNKTVDNFEKSLYSYNKAIDTLNTACDDLVADASFIEEVRCVGTNPTDKDAENETLYTSENLGKWPTTSAGILNGKAKDTDENYISDFDRMALLGLTNNTSFWLGSRLITEDSENVYFTVREINSTGLVANNILYVSESNTTVLTPERKVRPVVVLNSEANLVTDTTDEADYTIQ